METFLIRALQLIMALALLVTIHEGGHFLFAKLFKVRVEKFYLFFDPWFSLFKFKPKNSETEYGVGWLPLGGYVKIAGMVDESQNAEDLNHPVEPWEFRAKPAWQRLFIMIGGVLMNFLLALFLYSMILFTWGDSYVPLQSMEHGMKFNERAKEIGFQNGDILLRADDKAFTRYGVDMLRDITEADFVYVKRNGEEVAIDIPEDLSLLTIGNDATPFIDMLIPAVVDSVLADEPAKQVGIMQGDTLLAINNRAVSDFVEFTTQIAALRARSDSITAPEKVAALRDITLVVGRASGRDTLFAQLNEDFKLGVQPA
ncbi:MAG: site-2 protease family protein, partial [Bacteroidaceae bacterium]|nr:site-2 protease family protein [Bacteroidaceae bacterium]